jgi:hypothetical protein
MGMADAKISASIGLVLGWTSWQALLVDTFAGFALAAVYGGVLLSVHRVTRTSQLPVGPFHPPRLHPPRRPRGHRGHTRLGSHAPAAHSQSRWHMDGICAISRERAIQSAGLGSYIEPFAEVTVLWSDHGHAVAARKVMSSLE